MALAIKHLHYHLLLFRRAVLILIIIFIFRTITWFRTWNIIARGLFRRAVFNFIFIFRTITWFIRTWNIFVTVIEITVLIVRRWNIWKLERHSRFYWPPKIGWSSIPSLISGSPFASFSLTQSANKDADSSHQIDSILTEGGASQWFTNFFDKRWFVCIFVRRFNRGFGLQFLTGGFLSRYFAVLIIFGWATCTFLWHFERLKRQFMREKFC